MLAHDTVNITDLGAVMATLGDATIVIRQAV